MLVLTRRVGENLVIDTGREKITVTILEVTGRQVRIGTDAPDHVKVDREELYLRKKAEPEQ